MPVRLGRFYEFDEFERSPLCAGTGDDPKGHAGCPDARERAGPVFPPPPGGGNTGPARSRASGQSCW